MGQILSREKSAEIKALAADRCSSATEVGERSLARALECIEETPVRESSPADAGGGSCCGGHFRPVESTLLPVDPTLGNVAQAARRVNQIVCEPHFPEVSRAPPTSIPRHFALNQGFPADMLNACYRGRRSASSSPAMVCREGSISWHAFRHPLDCRPDPPPGGRGMRAGADRRDSRWPRPRRDGGRRGAGARGGAAADRATGSRSARSSRVFRLRVRLRDGGRRLPAMPPGGDPGHARSPAGNRAASSHTTRYRRLAAPRSERLTQRHSGDPFSSAPPSLL